MSTRPGEALDAAAVDAWLKPRMAGLRGVPEVTQFSGGASNWTYRLKYESHDLVLRRPPTGTKAKSSHDMGREYRVQKALAPLFPYVPEMMAYCEDPRVIGAEFYVMRKLEGLIPRAQLGVELDKPTTRQLCLNVINTWVKLHEVDVAKAGLSDLAKGAGYARRQVDGWSDRYAKARTWNVRSFSRVIDWLKERTPADVATCVIHNDFRFDNVVLDVANPTRVIGVLDWEMATLGDPLMDLGAGLAYWVQADDDFLGRATRRQPTHLPGMLKRDEVVAYYCGQRGLRADNWPFYEVYGLFRLAGIVQQIYYRYHHGQTRNRSFKRFWVMTNYLHWRCRQVMRRAR